MLKQEPDTPPDDTNSDLLQRALNQLLEQISNRDQKILWMKAERTAAVRSLEQAMQQMAEKMAETIAEKDVLLLHTQAQLTNTELQLHQILESSTWRMALFFQRIRNFLVPPQSRREQILRDGLSKSLFPFKRNRKN
jgi:hypothetical protein